MPCWNRRAQPTVREAGRKMLDMSQVERIRDMLAHGHTPTEVKTELGVSYPTIRKYAAQDDFSP